MRTDNGTAGSTRILVVDRDQSVHENCKTFLATHWDKNSSCSQVNSGREAFHALKNLEHDVVLCDLNTIADLDSDAQTALMRLASLAPGALVLATSELGSTSMAVACMQSGAHDYFAKPLNLQVVFERIEELSAHHGKYRQFSQIHTQSESVDFEGFVGASPQMKIIYEQIERIAAANSPAFITGESGTGKALCAEALHARSPRAENRFIAVECGALPHDLMEAELFGAVRGALTGVLENRTGAVECASDGTLFLDEIGALDQALQAKLLRLLQTGTINRIGDPVPRAVNVRIVCATSDNPMQMIADGILREDLFYRLHVLPVHLPPLRQRTTDIMPIAHNLLALYSREKGKRFTGFDREAMDLLMSRNWPGNVRQLQTLIHRVVSLYDDMRVTARMIRMAELDANTAEALADVSVARPANRDARAMAAMIQPLWKQEQKIIEETLGRCGGNISRAAAALEISPSTIYRKKQSWQKLEATANQRSSSAA